MMVVICLSDVADRFHGFLRSVMLNPHPGVYVAMDLDVASRDRIWRILDGWWKYDQRGMGVLIFRNQEKIGNFEIRNFGATKREVVEYDEVYALKR